MPADFTNATIVLLGRFAPDAFLPNVLVDAKIISQKEGGLAKIRTLLPGEAVQFQLSWGEVLILKDRFQISTTEAPYIRICDFVMKAFHDLSTESFVSAFGINLECHFDLRSIEDRDLLGRRVAPPEAWGPWGREILKSMQGELRLHGGVMSLQMRQPFAEEKVSGWLDVMVGPSMRISNDTGVFFRTNHHHQFLTQASEGDKADRSAQQPPDRLALLEFMASRFDASILSAENIFDDVLNSKVR